MTPEEAWRALVDAALEAGMPRRHARRHARRPRAALAWVVAFLAEGEASDERRRPVTAAVARVPVLW